MKSHNHELVQMMGELYNIMMMKGEVFRAKAYKKCQEIVMLYKEPIYEACQLKKVKGVGETMLNKINEYITTGKLDMLEREKNNPLYQLTNVYGIGCKKAQELIHTHNIQSIQQLRENQHLLNEKQKIGITYYEDILKRIPRSEIDLFYKLFQTILKDIDKKNTVTFQIVGSYRRGTKDSGDIDVIISDTHNNNEIFHQFLDELKERNIITHFLSRGNVKSLVIGNISYGSYTYPYRRIDFLYATPVEYPFSLLYFTGSAIFNTIMRERAREVGFTMNEHGIYHINKNKKMNKVNHIFSSEKDIFEFLGLEYRHPEERKDIHSIKYSSSISLQLQKKIHNNQDKINNQDKDNNQVKEINIKNKVKQAITKKKTKKQSSFISSKKTYKKKDTKKKEHNNVLNTYDKTQNEKQREEIKSHINHFKSNGISYLTQLNETTIERIIEELNDTYYNLNSSDETNQIPLLTDEQYDIIKNYMETTYPKNKIIRKVGATPIQKNKVKLPYYMPSMNKIKPDTNQLQQWKMKYNNSSYVLSVKLDGISGLYTIHENGEKKLYTRGNGEYGQDISYLIPYLKFPTLQNNHNLTIRGEIIMKKHIFNQYFKEEASNIRNLVAGIVNSKQINEEKYQYLDFVAYEVIEPSLYPERQFELLEEQRFQTALWKEVSPSSLSNELLSNYLVEWRDNYIYEIDGIIVSDNSQIHKRERENPQHSFAFKMVLSDQVVETNVVDVLWNISKDGYLKPRVQIEPVVIGGAKIEYTTGFNGKYINENKIGIGAIVQMVRSGDVIPYIIKVIKPAEKAKMPNDINYTWNKTGVDIIFCDTLTNKTITTSIQNEELETTTHSNMNQQLREKRVIKFFSDLQVECFNKGNIKRFMDAGFDTIYKILSMTYDDYLTIEGVKEKMAMKIYSSLHSKIKDVSLSKLMSASNIFGRGFGEKRIKFVLNKCPAILCNQKNEKHSIKQTNEDKRKKKIEQVQSIDGFGLKTSELFVDKIDDFFIFLKENNLEYKLDNFVEEQETKEKNIHKTQDNEKGQKTKQIFENHPLYHKKIVMTGFRDKQLETTLEKKYLVSLCSSVSKKTDLVIVKSMVDDTGKALKAKKLKIPMIELNECREKYNI